MNLLPNCLYIVSTPIGNLDDMTIRAIEVLKNSDIILCEDTRRSLKLLNYYNIKKKLVSYHKFNENKLINSIIEHINEGKILALISDARTPILSDPGNNLVKKCIQKKINIIPIPGVSSITSAMSVSGFKDQFLFYGFLPKKQNELDKAFKLLSNYSFTQVFFVPAVKIDFYLTNLKKYFSGRKLLIAREITKIHETFYREDINDLKPFKSKIKGELTLIVSEKLSNDKVYNEEKIVNKAKKYLKKYSLKDTVNLIFEIEKTNKKKIYDTCLKIKNEKNF